MVMNKIEKIVVYIKNRTWANYYTRIKQWLRETTTGVFIDRTIRFFLITAVSTFLTNYVIGQQVFPVIQTSFAVAAIALFDKIKNEWFASVREKESEEITTI